MSEALSVKLKKVHTLVWLFLGMLLYKFSMDLGYLHLTRISTQTYILDFNPLKYTLGLAWCILLFLPIRHTERKSSSFFIYFIFLFQIVPITSVYALRNESSPYYNLLCLSFLLCELLVGYIGERSVFRRIFSVSRIMTLSYTVAALLLIVYIIVKNGAPHLFLLDFDTIYEYRSSGAFQISKYMNYLLSWTFNVFLPFGIAKSLLDKRYPTAVIIMGTMILIYLYTGYRSYLFAAPFILVGTIWATRKNCYQELFLTGCIGFSALTLLAFFTRPGSLWHYIFSLFGRRTLLLSAQNKFFYYDYFLTHPKAGFSGVFPRWLINIPNPYAELSYNYDISAIYYNAPKMNSNTGFFAEGNLRFGPIGTVLLLLLLALLLKQMDRFQDRAGYPLAIGVFIYPILGLSDGHLLDSLVFGKWMFLSALLLFYIPRRMPPDPPALRFKRRRIALRFTRRCS